MVLCAAGAKADNLRIAHSQTADTCPRAERTRPLQDTPQLSLLAPACSGHRHRNAPGDLPPGDLLLYLLGQPVVVHVCVTHPLASSRYAIAAAAWGAGVSAKAKEALKRDKYSRTGTGTCHFVPLSHATHGPAGPPAFALLHEIAEFAALTGPVSLKIFMENAMHALSTTLWHRTAGPRLGAVASVPRWSTSSPGRTSPRWPVPTDGIA